MILETIQLQYEDFLFNRWLGGWEGKAVRILIQWWLLLWVQIPLEVTLFFVEAFKTLDVNFVQKCQICVANEKPKWYCDFSRRYIFTTRIRKMEEGPRSLPGVPQDKGASSQDWGTPPGIRLEYPSQFMLVIYWYSTWRLNVSTALSDHTRRHYSIQSKGLRSQLCVLYYSVFYIIFLIGLLVEILEGFVWLMLFQWINQSVNFTTGWQKFFTFLFILHHC